jgi:hypothetical protein
MKIDNFNGSIPIQQNQFPDIINKQIFHFINIITLQLFIKIITRIKDVHNTHTNSIKKQVKYLLYI